MTDAETGTTAELVYKKLGFTEVGKIPSYGLSPNSAPGELREETFFYKLLK